LEACDAKNEKNCFKFNYYDSKEDKKDNNGVLTDEEKSKKIQKIKKIWNDFENVNDKIEKKFKKTIS
jgi:hypothetical protein